MYTLFRNKMLLFNCKPVFLCGHMLMTSIQVNVLVNLGKHPEKYLLRPLILYMSTKFPGKGEYLLLLAHYLYVFLE